jgi:hexosaminidase
MKKRLHNKTTFCQTGAVTGLLFLFLIMIPAPALAQKGSEPATPSVIPRPAKLEVKSGVFTLSPRTTFAVDSKYAESLAVGEELAARLKQATGYAVGPAKSGKGGRGTIVLRTNDKLSRLGEEGYTLSVSKNSATIEAFKPAGLFYGVQTLYQLLPPQIEKPETTTGISWTIPCLKIEDQPRFRWRGVHLDVGRHYYPKEFILKYLDIMAAYKMNTFHWHLTEDQGWRIEIKKYPRLTEVGAWRRETMYDGKPHGGFYTQEEIREVVAHAKSRFITVVPEIEMPGHCQSALAAYPELSCSGGPFKVGTEWGVIHDVYCAGKEETFEFLQNVLTEVFDLFPGEFVHIGGDEVPKTRWQNCIYCQARIKVEELADEKELQSYFIRRIEKFLNANGKRLIGWDEILEGGLAPNATVMSWRGIVGGIEAAKSGHDVVMTPTSHCYFDYYQAQGGEPRTIGGYLPIDKVYSYEPVPSELTPEEARHILGAQANVWTEYQPNSGQVEYMLLPRMLALSEVVWTKKELRSFGDFTRRIVPQYDRLAAMGTEFRLPPPIGLEGKKILTEPPAVSIQPPFPGAEVRYTLDGSDPTPASPLLTAEPIEITTSALLQARTVLAGGRMSRTASTSFSIVDPSLNGLEYAYYEGAWYKIPDFASLTPVRTGQALDITLEPAEARTDNFALLFKGFIQIPSAGEYTFTIQADDGASIKIGDREVVRNDGLFSIWEVSGKVALEAGRQPIEVAYLQKSGGRRLDIYCEGPGTAKQLLPAHWLFRK